MSHDRTDSDLGNARTETLSSKRQKNPPFAISLCGMCVHLNKLSSRLFTSVQEPGTLATYPK